MQAHARAAEHSQEALQLRIRQLQADCAEAEKQRRQAHTNYENQVSAPCMEGLAEALHKGLEQHCQP